VALLARPPIVAEAAVFDDPWTSLRGLDPTDPTGLALLVAGLLLALVCVIVGRRLMREVIA
jgi:hypothetical protein